MPRTRQPLIGVYWGRFNPPHSGHLRMIRRFRKACRLTVAIGGSEHRDERRDPFSGRERKAMMEAYLEELGFRDVRVVALRDGPSATWSVRNLMRRCTPDLLFLSTERSDLNRVARRYVKVVSFRRTGRISSTRIRDSIAADDGGWRGLTGRSVARLIVGFGGVSRIKAAYGGASRRVRPGSSMRRPWTGARTRTPRPTRTSVKGRRAFR